MNLTDYVQSQPGAIGTLKCPVLAALAKKADCSPGTLYQVLLGHRMPSRKLAARISEATDGAITPTELLFPPLPAADAAA